MVLTLTTSYMVEKMKLHFVADEGYFSGFL